jgi:lysophospholipid acyltransferase (LPLAT)-like uncharacterized protein
MAVLRHITRSAAAQRCLWWLAALYIRLLHMTGRWRNDGADIADRLFAEGRPLILAFWHGRLLMMPCAWRHREQVHVLISGHRDGRLIAGAMSCFDIPTVTGSTRRGGAGAVLKLSRILRRGGVVAITPDGPRGPRMRVSPGIIQLARLTGAAILPMTYAARPRRRLASWDRFVLPFPFGRGLYLWGAPLTVPADADDAAQEAARRALEEQLVAMTDQADAALGLPRTEPAALTSAARS